MSETCTTDLSAGLTRKLRSLSRGLRLRFVSEGVAWFVLAAVLLVIATFALDWLLRLERVPRAVVMLGAYGALIWVIWTRVVCPLRVPLGRDDLGMLVELHYPELQSRLISVVQLAEGPLPPGTSHAMVGALTREADAMTGPMDFGTVIERKNLWRVVRLALCGVMLLAGLAAWQPKLMMIWAQRNVMLEDVFWPQRTYLEVDGEGFQILRGDDLTVRVRVIRDSQAPSSILVRANYPSVGWTEDRVKLPSAESREFLIEFRSVTEPFEFYVTGGDDQQDKLHPHEVTLIDPPSASSITFTVMPPSYAHRDPIVLEGGTGAITVPAGGELFLEAIATKPLASGQLVVHEDDQATTSDLRVKMVEDASGIERPLRVIGYLPMGLSNASRTAGLQIRLVDTLGYASRRDGEYILRVAPDQPPTVTAKKFGIGTVITPHARIPLRISGEDDHGLSAGAVEVSVLQDSTLTWSDPLTWVPNDDQTPHRAIQREVVADLAGRGVSAGDTVAVIVSLSDTLPSEMGGPNVNNASPIALRVVSPEDLMKDLVDRQKTLRLEFVQAMGQQQTAGMKTDELIADAEQMSPAQREGDVGQVAGLEQSVASEVAKTSQTLKEVLEELQNNRLGLPQDHEALVGEVIDPLDALSEEMAELLAEIEQARRQDDVGAMVEQLDAVAVRQEQVYDEMGEILKHMERLQSRQDLANQLRLIIRWSEQTLEDIRDREGREVENIWGDGDNEDTEGEPND